MQQLAQAAALVFASRVSFFASQRGRRAPTTAVIVHCAHIPQKKRACLAPSVRMKDLSVEEADFEEVGEGGSSSSVEETAEKRRRRFHDWREASWSPDDVPTTQVGPRCPISPG